MLSWCILFCSACIVTGLPSINQSDTKQHQVHICMITAYRKDHSYVQETSKELLAQITHNQQGARVTLSINSAGIVLADNPFAVALENRVIDHGPDCATPRQNHEDTGDPLPPCAVRQQGLDVANALSACYHRVDHVSTDWIILMEDDFMPCEDALTGVLKTLDGLKPMETKFARFTQGGGVVAFPVDNVLLYALSIMDNIATTPHDRILVLPWSPKPDFVFTRHLFKHVGNVSTIEYRNDLEFTRQYAGLRDNSCGEEIRV